MPPAFRSHATFAALLILVSAARLWFAGTVALSGDEAYHWEWSRRLAGSYYDHPGLTAWLIRAAGWVMAPDSEATVRLPAIVLMAGTTWVVFRMAGFASALAGATDAVQRRASWFAGLLVLGAPIYAVFGVYMSTDPPLIFASTLTWYLLLRALHGGSWWAWIGFGGALGLAFDAKFLAFVVPPAALLVMLLVRSYRRRLCTPRPWVALLVAVAVMSPVLVWNAQHDWATFRFNFGIRHEERPWKVTYPLEYVAGQMGCVLPMLFLSCVVALARAWRRWRDGCEWALLLLVAGAAPLGLFLAASFVRRVGVHWPAAAWSPILVLVAIGWAESGQAGRRWRRWVFATTFGPVLLAHALVHVPPAWTQFGADVDRPPSMAIQRFNERFGWRELGAGVEFAYRDLVDERGPAFLIAGSYGFAAAVSFYQPDQERVQLWSPRRRHGENYRYWDRWEELAGRDAIFVAKRRSQADEMEAALRARFARVTRLREIPITVDGIHVHTFYYRRCYEYDGVPPY